MFYVVPLPVATDVEDHDLLAIADTKLLCGRWIKLSSWYTPCSMRHMIAHRETNMVTVYIGSHQYMYGMTHVCQANR
eukprot:4756134-Pleurochrysis_carterae.AAC.1